MCGARVRLVDISGRGGFFEMADENNAQQNQNAAAATASAQHDESARQGDVTTGRGGEQSDQISGETQKGAHNQEAQGRNPQGNKPDRN
jgi:hypothetical protein